MTKAYCGWDNKQMDLIDIKRLPDKDVFSFICPKCHTAVTVFN